MSGSGVSTGVALGSQSPPCEDYPDPCVYFDSTSTSEHSHVFDVSEPMQVLAFDMPECDAVVLQQVSGGNEGDHFEDVVIGGCRLALTARSNRILIPFAGRFRLRYEGEVGTAQVVCEPTDCCFASIYPENTMNHCNSAGMSNTEIAASLAFRTCDGGAVTPGEQLATCADLQTALGGLVFPEPLVLVNTSGAAIASGSPVLTPGDLPAYTTASGSSLPSDACVAQCSDVNAVAVQVSTIAATLPYSLDLSGSTLSILDSGGVTLSQADLSGLVASAGGLSGVDNGDGLLTVTTADGTATVDIAISALVAALCGNAAFQECLAQKVLQYIDANGTIAHDTDGAGGFVHNGC